METCANCGAAIGTLETPRVYRNQTVCFECWQRLSAQDATLNYQTPGLAPDAYPKSAILRLGRIVFGGLAVLGFIMAGVGEAGRNRNEEGTGLMLVLVAGGIFLLTFVKRIF